jgi:hypothetical protein
MKTTKRSFRAARQLKLHRRICDLLEMVVECDKRYGDAVDTLNLYDNTTDWMQPIRLMNDRGYLVSKCNKYFRIKERLTKYYAEIMSRVEDIAILHVENKTEINNY